MLAFVWATTGELWPRNCLQRRFTCSVVDFWGFSSRNLGVPRIVRSYADYWKCATTVDGQIFTIKIFRLLLRPYRANLMFHRSADAVFVTNNKKLKLFFVCECVKLGARLFGYRYVVLFPGWGGVNYRVPQSKVAASLSSFVVTMSFYGAINGN